MTNNLDDIVPTLEEHVRRGVDAEVQKFWSGVETVSVDGPCPCGAPRAEWHPHTKRCEAKRANP